ncbi:MAG: hypothetical protein HKN35_14670 [Woeseia sp.]|nr:hypothetical protein [Woeseia sp.]MBT8096073.1 hypothetical protein [Woeseia sp.]NNE62136.1 hypothetical protein [Woeseia sp.]NNL54904.1 hypothetical protein [Woeseia sp.]
MSIRHYASDIDELDDPTYRMLGSRLSRVAFSGERHEVQRQRREYDAQEKIRRVRKPRERYDFE